MATYVFDTMTDAQGATYSAATDTIVFTNPSSTANKMSVAFVTTVVPGSATTTGSTTVTATITDAVTGHTVAFGTGVLGESDFLFADASKLFVGDASANTWTGGSTNDAAFGGGDDDILTGGAGADVLQGNQGGDTEQGNAGADTIYG